MFTTTRAEASFAAWPHKGTPGEDGCNATLCRGVDAVVSAMASEAQFANNNEVAFGLLRKGCVFCAQLPDRLDAIGPKDTVVAFLARAAARRNRARQLVEICEILLQSSVWQEIIHGAPSVLREFLTHSLRSNSWVGGQKELPAANRPPHLFCRASQESLVARTLAGVPAGNVSVGLPTVAPPEFPPEDGARLFLREMETGRYLTIKEVESIEQVVMTESPASLLVCHHLPPESEIAKEPPTHMTLGAWSATSLGFAHEGVPALGLFLASRRPWRRAWEAFGRGEFELCCTSQRLGHREEFLWHVDRTIQHAASGRWLYVDPKFPDEVVAHEKFRSWWEVQHATRA